MKARADVLPAPGDDLLELPGASDFRPDKKLIARILANNHGDYMSLSLFSCLVHGPAPTAQKNHLVLLYLAHLLAEGYVTIGDVYDNEFLSWNCGVAEAVSWVSVQLPDGNPDFICAKQQAWLNNTPRGNDIALTAKRRRRVAA
ncbi:hypothetical protein FCN77_02380 [Arthrobacter sp. 24S4-2]|uniref:hypothetical protein n=1 Tax=Arthrobacter sp. 24S4-2 TaxID=2575374 RepID=UPI0010C7AAED|nr:hypothetical protein [Arthrobacter sp. 24S4-2]QCO96776.1 hypothetical protein FCN77_02380 [Arthrobacter sp. 24S4-2]